LSYGRKKTIQIKISKIKNHSQNIKISLRKSKTK